MAQLTSQRQLDLNLADSLLHCSCAHRLPGTGDLLTDVRYTWLTDSKAAISKVTFILRPSHTPRQYPDDVDFVTAIRELHRTLGSRAIKCKWVKGHQDDDMAYENVSRSAQLNIDADALASAYYWSGNGRKPTPNIPHFPEHKITISINGIRYPSKIDQQIRFHINGSYLKNHLQKRHRWNEKLWYSLDFDAFGRHFKKLDVHKQIQHMKFVHDIQPIGVNNAKLMYANDATPKNTTSVSQCPCCCQALETQVHMLHCRDNPSRSKSLTKFKTHCKRRDGNWFLPIFADIIGQWMTDPNTIPTFDKSRDTFLQYEIIPLEYSQLVQQAISEQTAIGWSYAIRGFIGKTWLKLASCTYNSDSGEVFHRHDGIFRIQQAIKAMYHLTTEIWVGRNDVLHSIKQTDRKRQQNLVDATITSYHEDPDLLLHDDKHYCDTSLARLLRSSASNKRRWLHRVKQSRKRKSSLLPANQESPNISSPKNPPNQARPMAASKLSQDPQHQRGR
jgi:hypothetical protein